MKILVLGHKGMLGSDLMLRLSANHEVIGNDIDDLDIISRDACREVILATGPDVVINAAAYTDVDACESSREKCFSINADGVKNIALACEMRNIKIVHFSTDYVYDGRKEAPYVEDDIGNPINVYGQSKLEGENYLRMLSKNFLLIRSAWLYGLKGRNFARTIMEKAGTVSRIEVVDDQIGSPTYARDLAAAVQFLIEGNFTGIFHVTNRGSCSRYEYALKILQYIDMTHVVVVPIKSDQLANPAHRPPYSVLSCRKLFNMTGRAMRPWQIALGDYIEKVKQYKL